jgi:hypothetical protein
VFSREKQLFSFRVPDPNHDHHHACMCYLAESHQALNLLDLCSMIFSFSQGGCLRDQASKYLLFISLSICLHAREYAVLHGCERELRELLPLCDGVTSLAGRVVDTLLLQLEPQEKVWGAVTSLWEHQGCSPLCYTNACGQPLFEVRMRHRQGVPVQGRCAGGLSASASMAAYRRKGPACSRISHT